MINKLLVLLILPCLLISCNHSQEGKKPKRDLKDRIPGYNYRAELTQEQQTAFDALNTLQTSTDEMNRLYSTFANVDQPFYPADTSFEISQSEWLVFLEQFISKHCQELAPEIQNQLAKSAALAQDSYRVLYCTRNESKPNYEEGLPMTDVWVLSSVLGRRDVILVW